MRETEVTFIRFLLRYSCCVHSLHILRMRILYHVRNCKRNRKYKLRKHRKLTYVLIKLRANAVDGY